MGRRIVFGPDLMPEVEFCASVVAIGCLPGSYDVYASLSLADLKTMIAMFVAHLRLHPNNATKAHAGLKDVSADLTYLANLAQGYVPGDFPDEDESGVAA